MNTSRLPIKLEKEPLIDVICEVRFASNQPASALLPGMLMSAAPPGASFEALPASQLPSMVRDKDPNLRHAVLMRMTWGQDFVILFGDRSIGVGCKMPYAGWTKFKPVIQSVFSVLEQAYFVEKVERHSLKYVDFFPQNDLGLTDLSAFNVNIQVGGALVTTQTAQLRVELPDGPFLHAVSLISPAELQVSNKAGLVGSVLDVDTHRIQEFSSAHEFVYRLPGLLEELHDSNKRFFFNLITPKSLQDLGPIYD